MTATMAWQPEAKPLAQLSEYLKDSLSGHKNAQKHAELMLGHARSSPDVNNYLTYLFSNSQPPMGLSYTSSEYHSVRSAAAIMLKNNIRSGYKTIPEPSLALIKSTIPAGLRDTNPQIRSLAGNVITEIIRSGGIRGWPQLLPQLIDLVSNTSGDVTKDTQEGAMNALFKICEDNTKLLDKEFQGQRPLDVLIPKLIDFARSPVARVRTLSLTTLNVFIPHKSGALLVNLDPLLNQLFSVLYDTSLDVRRQVCRAFVQIVDIAPNKILPFLDGLVDYILSQQRRVQEGSQERVQDEELACDAAEFWLTIGENRDVFPSLAPYLNKIIPVLLDSMVYSEEDIALLEGGDDDADKDDREEDIRPTFARNLGLRNYANGENTTDANASQVGGSRTGPVDDQDDDDDEGELELSDDDDDDSSGGYDADQWNLRKCSAAALDVFASDFGDPVFNTISQYLENNLKHNDWPQREASVLALGAVAEGCIGAVTPHLPNLVPYLIALLNDSEPLVRQITCWTLGRYSSWAVELTGPYRSQFFEPMMEGLLTKMLDRNKRVQEAAASAFAHLEEKAGKGLIPYCGGIIKQYVLCFEKYKDRNMFILYDCVQTLAEHVGPELSRPELIQLLMPALMQRYTKVSDQSRELFPLLECLSYVATALGTNFAPFAEPIFTRCIKIIKQTLEDSHTARGNPNSEQPDTDFLVTSLDLLSAIIQVVTGQKSSELVSGSHPGVFELLIVCMEYQKNDVRQSSYALLGDCAKYVFPQLQLFVPRIMPVLIKQLDLNNVLDRQTEHGFSVVNNACWSVGEIAVQHGKGMAPFVEPLFQRLLNILGNPEVPSSVNENAGIALGRLGQEHAVALGPHLAMFSAPFLTAMENVEYTEEKASAFIGFTLIVGCNPEAMEKDLVQYFTAIARYKFSIVSFNTTYHNNLKALFIQVINAYRSIMPNFNGFLAQLPAPDQESLLLGYDVKP